MTTLSAPAHRINYRVYFEDTDAGGVMYHGNYLNFCERARTEWLHDLGFMQRDLMAGHGIGFVVRKAEIDYRKPLRLEDVVTVESRLHEMGRSSMTMHQQLVCNGELAAHITVVLVCINREFKPCRLPDDIRAAIVKDGAAT